MIKYIKFYLNNLFNRPKYILKGHCKKCGRCCRNIIFFAYNKPITDENIFEELKQKNKRINLFYLSGKNEKGELLFTCKSLKADNTCKHYFFRSLYCRKYPLVKSLSSGKYLKPSENCGYELVLSKSFKDYL